MLIEFIMVYSLIGILHSSDMFMKYESTKILHSGQEKGIVTLFALVSNPILRASVSMQLVVNKNEINDIPYFFDITYRKPPYMTALA